MPTHFSGGVTDQTGVGNPLYNFGQFDPTKWITYWNDFHTYDASTNFVETAVGSSSAAINPLVDNPGGILTITTGALENDGLNMQQGDGTNVAEPFAYSATKKMFFKCRFKISDATQSDFAIGLVITDTAAAAGAPTDCVYFHKEDGDTNLDFSVAKDSTATDATAIHTMVDATWVTVAFFYDPQTYTFKYYVDDVMIGSSVNTNAPDDEELAVTISVLTGAAAAKTMDVDYVFAAIER